MGKSALALNIAEHIVTENHLAVAMFNDLEQVCAGCEAIVCAERKEAYEFVVKFMCRNSPGAISSVLIECASATASKLSVM